MHVIPVQVGREEAEELVLQRLPGASSMSSRLLHHPYAGMVYRIEQAAFGKRMHGEIHTMVDLCSGAAAVSDAWPEPTDERIEDGLDGPSPVLDMRAAERQARQCVVRGLLHRRFSLRHPNVHLVDRVFPLHKPNWLMSVQVADGPAFGVLVDGLSGIHHTVPLPRLATENIS